jgi:hypothetical protein
MSGTIAPFGRVAAIPTFGSRQLTQRHAREPAETFRSVDALTAGLRRRAAAAKAARRRLIVSITVPATLGMTVLLCFYT